MEVCASTHDTNKVRRKGWDFTPLRKGRLAGTSLQTCTNIFASLTHEQRKNIGQAHVRDVPILVQVWRLVPAPAPKVRTNRPLSQRGSPTLSFATVQILFSVYPITFNSPFLNTSSSSIFPVLTRHHSERGKNGRPTSIPCARMSRITPLMSLPVLKNTKLVWLRT